MSDRLTDQEVADYAEYLIRDHAKDIEWITINELYEEWADDDPELPEEISEEDMGRVGEAILRAKVSVVIP